MMFVGLQNQYGQKKKLKSFSDLSVKASSLSGEVAWPRPSGLGELGEDVLSRLLPRPDLVDYTVTRLDFLTYHDRVKVFM